MATLEKFALVLTSQSREIWLISVHYLYNVKQAKMLVIKANFDLEIFTSLHCVSKNDNDVLRYNFNAHQPILIIFGRYIAEWICY